VAEKGGTMRLGVWPCKLVPGTRAAAAYDQPIVYERHRHRYEFNNEYRELLTAGGMALSGLSPDGRLVEIAELEDHPFMLGSQFHPEFKSRPQLPHPLFRDFVRAAREYHLARREAMDVIEEQAIEGSAAPVTGSGQ
jgi:CTP synthase